MNVKIVLRTQLINIFFIILTKLIQFHIQQLGKKNLLNKLNYNLNKTAVTQIQNIQQNPFHLTIIFLTLEQSTSTSIHSSTKNNISALTMDSSLNEIRGSQKQLPPLGLKKLGSMNRIQLQNLSESSVDSKVPLKPKPLKGYELAEYTRAVDYLHSQSYMRKTTLPNGDIDYQPYGLFSQNQQMRHYGLGVYLYLQFIKRLTITFLIMSAIVALPIIYTFINGSGLSSFKSSYTIQLAKTSLGNIHSGDRMIYLLFTIGDLLSMIVLFGFYLNWRSFHAEVVSNQVKDPSMINPANFVVSVGGFDVLTQGLERNLEKYVNGIVAPVYRQQLNQMNPSLQYLQQSPQTLPQPQQSASKTFQVQVMYNYNGCFSKFIQYDQLVEEKQKQRQLMIHTGKSNEEFLKLSKKITKLQDELSQISQAFQPYQAIIHFQTIKSKINFINFSRKYSLIDKLSYSLKRLLCCLKLPAKNQLFMQRDALLIKSTQLSRPQQINWQNLDISAVSKVIRWIVSILFLLIAMLITSSAIALCTLYVSSTSACTNYDSTTLLAAAKLAGGQTLYCYCSANIASIYTDVQISAACSDLSTTILYSNLMLIGASLVSSISNILLIIFVGLTSRYVLKPSSRPVQFSFTFVGVLLSNYINASVLPLIMNGNIFGFASLSYLKFINFIDFKKVAIFDDYTIDWYAVVAPYYMNFLIIAIVSPIMNLLVTCLSDCWTRWRVKKACQNCKASPIIQKQANKLIASMEFDLATEKAIICLNFFISIMYSSLLPILLPITTLYLLITFFCKKYIILHYSIRIPADQALSQKAIMLIPFAMLIHFLMGIWSHTAIGVFSDGAYVFKIGGGFLDKQHVIIQRAFVDVLMLAGAAVVAVWIVLDYTVVKFFTVLIDCFKDQIQVPKELASQQNKPYPSLVKKTNILSSYKLINNPTYGHAIKAYQQLKKRRQKQITKKTQSGSPQKLGQQTMSTINLKNSQELISMNQLLPGANRYQKQ